jgi:hypothetical protein
MLIVTLGGILAVTIAGAVWLWMEIGDVRMSTFGVISLIGGGIVALAVGGGLMALVFYSARRGYDDLDR